MISCFSVEFQTPNGLQLRGLWYGPKKPERTILFVHGLGGSVFSMRNLLPGLADKKTAVLSFGNRGHDQVSVLTRHVGTKKERIQAGAAHEKFVDCVDDIDGAIAFVKQQGAQSIYLAGHSTGCQKSAYWAYKRGQGVKGIILLAPISDWAAAMKIQGVAQVQKATRAAMKLVAAKKPHTLLPEGVWHETLDAQRFLSLYSRDSVEEIFSYAQPKKSPKVLRSIKIPMLVLMGEKDEFADRPASEIGLWFKAYIADHSSVDVIVGATHGFDNAEEQTAETIRKFIQR